MLKSHKGVHAGKKRYECSLCGKLFGQSHPKKTHEEYAHLIGSERPYKCKLCGKCYNNPVYHKRHEENHFVLPTYCKQCDKNIKNLPQHKNKVHLGEGQSAICRYCSANFPTRLQKKLHEGSHSKFDKTQQCKFCELRTTKLKEHEQIHTSEGLYKCVSCEYTGHQSNQLKSHNQLHHEGKRSKQTECKICAKKVTKMSDHLLSHSDEGKFLCSLCPKKFMTPTSINIHPYIGKHIDIK